MHAERRTQLRLLLQKQRVETYGSQPGYAQSAGPAEIIIPNYARYVEAE
jgi:hypothetical protein